MRVCRRQDVANVVSALPFRRRGIIARPRQIGRQAAALQIVHGARAIGKQLAFHAHHQLRPVVTGQGVGIVKDCRTTVDANTESFAVELSRIAVQHSDFG